jgi:hypothetical protein
MCDPAHIREKIRQSQCLICARKPASPVLAEVFGFLSREIVDRAVLSLKDAGVPSFLIE